MNIHDIDAGDVAVAVSAVAGAGLAVVCAPAIGAALSALGLGAAAGTLSGVAASNAGLAALGGGSLVSGGLGIAGGTTVLGAGGAAIGVGMEKAGEAIKDKFHSVSSHLSHTPELDSESIALGAGGGAAGVAIEKTGEAIQNQIDSIIAPDPSYLSQLTELGSESMEAAGLSLAVNLLPELVFGTAAALRGEKSIVEVVSSIGNKVKSCGLKVGGDTFVKSGLSGVLANTDAFDPTGAVLVVTLAVDIAKHAFALNKGEINSDEFIKRAKETIVNKGSSILLTSAAIGLVGPAGIITPLIVASLIKNAKIREQVSSSLDAVFADAEELIQKQIEILKTSQQAYAYSQETRRLGQQSSDSADAGIDASKKSIKLLEDKLARQAKIKNRLTDPEK